MIQAFKVQELGEAELQEKERRVVELDKELASKRVWKSREYAQKLGESLRLRRELACYRRGEVD